MVHVHFREPAPDKPLVCPNQSCHYHDRTHADQSRWFHRFGVFRNKTRGLIHRFRCRGNACSTQTFSTSYWAHSR